ncbi:MAG: thioredoxin domain-containing protein [Eubacteriaceae bacterium]|jgi:uncharacterized protein YyaL (SSP411 family)|nr:thioredoxin domain-containing protein [Eubacteriaceae bacterium]
MKKNKLAETHSPYLLQHAHQPIHWYPWGEEAFQEAKRRNVPVFLSIGYSTCHWCHVMARESFEDASVALILNNSYVAIKVDREEHPDVDHLYMTAAQTMTGGGGWPLTLLLTPDKEPFFAGTYIPKEDRGGAMGLKTLLTNASRSYHLTPQKVEDLAKRITQSLADSVFVKESERTLTEADLDRGFAILQKDYDTVNGGFGKAPKFPVPQHLLFLMAHYNRTGDQKALEMVEHTLRQMAKGGIYDHLGGGFSRYSVDEKWLVPHFEKTLYDNALLALAAVQTYAATAKPFYQTIAEETLNYVLESLGDEQGGFYCGQDADSEGKEGKYYVFTRDEIEKVIGDENKAQDFCKAYGVVRGGNFEGRTILNLLDNPEDEKARQDFAEERQALKAYRENRVALHTDDKILTGWNGYAIAALSQAGLILDATHYTEAAIKAVDFIERELRQEDGTLWRRYYRGQVGIAGQLEDYSCYTWGLLTLYQNTQDVRYLELAQINCDLMVNLFYDEQGGLFFQSRQKEKDLLVRTKDIYDGAAPTANAVALYALHQMGQIDADPRWQQLVEDSLRAMGEQISRYPTAFSFILAMVSEKMSGGRELICVLTETSIEDVLRWKREQKDQALTLVTLTEKNSKKLYLIAPYLKNYPLKEEGFYLCHDRVCEQPQKTLKELKMPKDR